jgi:hypothetical protein
MTPTAWGALLAAVVFVTGIVYFARRTSGRGQMVGIAGTLAATVIIGWIAWYAGVQV